MKVLITLFLFNLSLSYSQKNDSLFKRFEIMIDTLKIDESQKQLFLEEMNTFIYRRNNEGILKLENKTLLSFSLQKLDGDKLWSETLRGKPTVLVFWNSNCQPCIDQAPTLNALKKQYGNQVNFIAITYQDEKEVRDFLEDVKFNYLHLIDAKAYTEKIENWTYPKTLVLDTDLIIRYIGNPQKSETYKEEIENHNVFKKELETLLNDFLFID